MPSRAIAVNGFTQHRHLIAPLAPFLPKWFRTELWFVQDFSSWNHRLFSYYLDRVSRPHTPPRNDPKTTVWIEQLNVDDSVCALNGPFSRNGVQESMMQGSSIRNSFFKTNRRIATQVPGMALPVSWFLFNIRARSEVYKDSDSHSSAFRIEPDSYRIHSSQGTMTGSGLLKVLAIEITANWTRTGSHPPQISLSET